MFTSWSNPKSNSGTERVIKTLKEDLIWCYDWDHPFDFQRALIKWIGSYNQDFLHQGYVIEPFVNTIKNMLRIKRKY